MLALHHPRAIARTVITIIALALSICSRGMAQAGEIKVLIIGNDTYQQSGLFPSLRGTPRKDADAVESALKSAGVAKGNITTLYDLDYNGFFEAIYKFRQSLNERDYAIFYYSGHGFSADGSAYLAPVDFRAERTKRDLRRRAVSLDQVKKDLAFAQMRALIIDACRTNIPLLKQASGLNSALPLSNLYDSTQPGRGELIVFATQNGREAIAESPAQGLSYFTYFLVNRFDGSQPDLATIAHDAQIATANASHHGQEPDVRDNLLGVLVLPSYAKKKTFAPPPPPLQVSTPPTQDDIARLPFICPPNNVLFGGWTMGNRKANYLSSRLNKNFPLRYGSPNQAIQAKNTFTAELSDNFGERMNPVLRANVTGGKAVVLPPELSEGGDALFAEIDQILGSPAPLRGQDGPIQITRELSGVRYRLDAPDKLGVFVNQYAGNVTVKNETKELSIGEFTSITQSLFPQLNKLGLDNIGEVCEMALKRFTER